MEKDTHITEVKVEYWDNISYTSCDSEIKSVETWNGTKEEIFKKFDKKNNRLRYCNGSYYEFQDKKLKQEYLEWYRSLSKSTKFNMFYGNGVVD
jgi:uncharacterized protein YecT (DUF1311 family)